MATIQKRKTKGGEIRYKVTIRLRGTETQTATFRRLTDAKQWEQATEAAIREGRYFRSSEAQRRTLAELIDRYDEEVLSQKPIERRRDQQRHLAWWRQECGHLLLRDVTPAVLSKARSKLRSGADLGSSGSERSPGTVNRYVGSVRHALSVAEREWEWVEENAAKRLQPLKEPKGRTRFLDDGERARLLKACKASSDRRLYPLVVMALGTGARQGELLRLEWPDLDLENMRVVFRETKNDEQRSVGLSSHVLKALEPLRKVRSIQSNLIFANRKGKAPFPRWAWQRALEEAEIKDFRFHDLRHTAASYLARGGASLMELSAVLGHKSLQMVQRYAHLTEDHTSDIVHRMNEEVFG